MGVQERERKVYRPLRRAGLEVIPGAVPKDTIPFCGGYGREDVVGGFSHPYDTPKLVERLNADWYELALSSGLLDDRREFLVMLPQGTRTHRAALRHQHDGGSAVWQWTRVRLLERWDIMGLGADTAFLGVYAGHPGFGMLALDGSVYLCCSTGERGIDVLAVRQPDRSPHVLRHLEWLAARDSPYVPRAFTARIARWIEGRAPTA
ncbi:hypothetical protein [Streptomyces laurentii]|uniref:hypothetical protein n=1 Tax=Streptomyces laurentii TaxID=39478 RepID=UPI00369DAA36